MSTHQETENSSLIFNEMNINYLNDECFMEIFKYLTTGEKLEASLVCTRWACILVNKLDINDELIKEIKEIDEESNYLPFYYVLGYIKTCGNYLNYLKIDFDVTRDYTTWIIKEIANNCKNIMHLEFLDFEDGDLNFLDFTVNEDDIELIFKNNINLRTLKLIYLRLNGKCLLKLQPILEEFVVHYCRFDSINCLFDFLSRLNNVRILKINLFAYYDKEFLFYNRMSINLKKKLESIAINCLNKSNSEDIIEFEWISVGLDETNELSDLLSKQKKLRQLKLRKIKFDETFFEHLSKNQNLEILEIDFIENQVHFLFPQFKNLQVIKWSNLVISDEIVQILIMCKNLKDLELFQVSDYLLTEDGESAFGELENLESFGISVWQKNINNILLALTQCKDLKIIDITGCRFTDTGLKSLLKVPKLTNLNVSKTSITNDQLEKLAKESSLLQLEVFECENLSTEILDEISWDIHLGTYNLKLKYDRHWYSPIYSTDGSSFDDDGSDEDTSDESYFDALEGINRLFED